MIALGSSVSVVATGARGVVGEVSPLGQCRVDLPDGRWGWHYPAEIEACEPPPAPTPSIARDRHAAWCEMHRNVAPVLDMTDSERAS